ncbi:hypothetical protein N9K60_02095 [Candidatus Poseidoniales archaeon]|nr:hypothetical protein [Candidatus Poseidoniales archaeon]MDB4656892.1 hypothetical protein [Candidatus Poseidoniaceae archaeon]
MANNPEWRWYTLAGLLMVIQTLFDFAPAGPWNAPSFTRGLVGLVGLCCIYLGWFRFTFKSNGIIPSINRWQTPKESWKKVLVFSISCFVIVGILQLNEIKDSLPDTAGMIVMLIGCLSMLNSIYVGLVISGPLNEAEEE